MKTNYEVRQASHPSDAKKYDTAQIREHYLIEKVMAPDEVNMVYSMIDRIIAGGAMPVEETLALEAVEIVKADYFLTRREMGIINVGGPGVVTAGDYRYELDFKEALYLGRGDREITFASRESGNPAKFYFNSAPAHRTCPDRMITKKDAVVMELGSLEGSNHRFINRMIVQEVVETCQLQMGMTELQPGSVWNTMPVHIHDRRMEVYFYFDLPEDQAVCHFMGEPTETRHLWMHNQQAVISPPWSIHAASATSSYTFIWGMCGENLDYSDQDFFRTTEIR